MITIFFHGNIKIIFGFFQPVLVTLSSKADPVWRDYEQQCLTSSDNTSGSTVAHIMTPPSYNSPPIEDMILIKREGPAGPTGAPGAPTGYSTSEFSIPDSSSQISQKSSSTMWEDIASSIKKLDPDHADVLLEAAGAPNAGALPPVSTVVSGGGDYYPPPPPQYNANFSESDLFSNTTRLSNR